MINQMKKRAKKAKGINHIEVKKIKVQNNRLVHKNHKDHIVATQTPKANILTKEKVAEAMIKSQKK